MGIYDRYLAYRVRRLTAPAPAHVALIITERDLLQTGAYDTLEAFLTWAFDYQAERVTVYVSVLDRDAVPPLQRALADIQSPVDMAVIGPEGAEQSTAPIQVSIGLGGKHEFAQTVQRIVRRVEAGALDPDEIDATDIEDHLIFSHEPDLVIKTGAERLSDFMIWQSVYSELYFTDVNWQNFRRRDYLRALLSYKQRHRRYGR